MSEVTLERRGAVVIATVNRPEALNALNAAVIDGLAAALDQLGDARALIVTGAGTKAFVAGADIAAMRGLDHRAAADFARRGQAVLARLEALSIPVIAAVNGFALGGGCELAMACDLILAAPNAVFGQPEVRLGVIPGFGGTQRLVRRVGEMRAKELIFSGRTVKADEAVALGLALRVVDPVIDAAMALGEEIARMGPVAVRLAKHAIGGASDVTLAAGLSAEAEMFGLCFDTADQKEGMSAFLEKRKATFTGR